MKHIRRLYMSLSFVAALAAAGCAHRPPPPAQQASGPVANGAPPVWVHPGSLGQWRDLGVTHAPWLAGEMPAPVARAATRAASLRDAHGRLLALVIMQTAPGQSADCRALDSLRVPDQAGRPSPDCLRMRRDALFDHYLEHQNPLLWAWLGEQGLTPPPAAWVAVRAPGSQQLLEVHVLLEPALLEAVTRSNSDFLGAGHAGVHWARQLAQAARQAASGQPLLMPPFPYAPAAQKASPEPAAPVSPPAPAGKNATAPSARPQTAGGQTPDQGLPAPENHR